MVATPKFHTKAKILTYDRPTKILFTRGKKDKVAPFSCFLLFLHQPSHHFHQASSLIQVHSIWLQYFLVMLLLSPSPPFSYIVSGPVPMSNLLFNSFHTRLNKYIFPLCRRHDYTLKNPKLCSSFISNKRSIQNIFRLQNKLE